MIYIYILGVVVYLIWVVTAYFHNLKDKTCSEGEIDFIVRYFTVSMITLYLNQMKKSKLLFLSYYFSFIPV